MARVRKTASVPGRKAKVLPPEPKPRACRECKKQKIFCSKHFPKCERCQARSIECVYTGPKKIKVNEENLRYLKAKLQRYEEIFESLPAEVFNSLPDKLSPLTSMPEDKEDDDDEDDLSEGADEADGSLPDQFKQMSIYLRASRGSADNFFQIATKLSGLRGDDSGHDSGLEQTPVFYDPGMLPARKPEINQNISLPPVDIARQYFAAQHMYIGTIFAFSDPETFGKQLADAYEGPPNVNDTKSCLTYAKILMILALGRLYSVNRQSSSEGNQPNDHPPGFTYFSHALALLPDVHEKGSILGVETLAYVGYFMQNMNRRDAAFLYIGIALRMAISLGLHQEAPSLKLTESEREHRRRVWWSIYSLDRILSLKSGNPISILDEDIGVDMPLRLAWEPEDSPVVVLRCYTELSRILGEITTLIYRRTSHTGQTLIVTVHSILQSLNQWEEALPRALRLDPDRGKLSRESISMYLHYYQCINMTARPLLFHVVQKRITSIREARPMGQAEKERDWQNGLSKKTIAVINACISAARNTILVMSKAAEHNMVATYGYMDSEHAFSAAIVLVLVYTSFPTSPSNVESMAKGLDLLRRMGDLGNSYVAARYQQLSRLRSILADSKVPDAVSSTSVLNAPEQSLPQAVPTGSGRTVVAEDHTPDQIPILYHIPDEIEQHQHQPHQGDFAADVTDFDDQAYFNLDLAAIDASGVLFDPDTNMLVEDADNTLWTSAFTNPVGFDISQLIPETDMSDYFRL